ncbi:MAG: nucleoside triphosphate pyrophosphohydrolase [Anaerolineae bacterium]|nr:MAG: nucleoside triphosphate pyrophosphohydrolase [Anaerolineae bacterium]
MLSTQQFERLVSLLKLDALQALSLVDGKVLASRHVPPFPPDAPALVLGVQDVGQMEAVCRVLLSVYPAEHVVWLVGWPSEAITESTLANVPSLLSAPLQAGEWLVYVPPLPAGSSFETFQEIIAHLRAPDGCPWDRKQTHQTLRKYLLEESYEALAAMDANDAVKMREEFGDLLLQVVLNAQIGYEQGEFTMTEVLKEIHDKLVRRHPHVFGSVEVDSVGQVLQNWEAIKKEERREKGEEENSLLASLPAALPALSQAQEYQSRAARVGFDWPEVEGVLEKIREEIEEIRRSTSLAELTAEVGDLLFALVNLARWKKVDAESALRETNLKFKTRLGHIEKRAREMGRAMQEMSLQELDALWNEAKQQEAGGSQGSQT